MAEDTSGDDIMDSPVEPANHGQPSSKPANHTDCPDLPKGAAEIEGKEQVDSKTDGDVLLPQNDVHKDVVDDSGDGDKAVAMEIRADGDDVDSAGDAKGTDDDRKTEESREDANNTDEKRTGDDAMETLNSEEKTASGNKVDRTRQSSSESSDSETDTNEEDDDDDDAKKASDHEISSDLENELLARELPKPKLQAVRQIQAREFGYYQRCGQPFCHNFTGSVALVQRLEKYCELKHHEGCVNTLHFNQSGELLASGSDDLEIVLWDWAKKSPRLNFESGHRSNVFQAKFMPCSGDTTLVSCARDGQVRVAELSRTGVCKETKKLLQHKGAAHKLGLEPDSPVVFMSCGEDAAVYNIDLREPKPTKLMLVKEDGKKVALYTIHINPSDVNEFTVGGRDHFIRIYDKRRITDDDSSGVLKKFCPHHLLDNELKANVTCCLYSHNGQEILASYNDEDTYLFDSSHSDGADFIHSYKGHRNNATVKGVNFYGPNSEFIVSGSDCGNVFLWEKESEKIVQYMQGDMGGVVNCLEPHPTIACLATSGLDHDVKVWLPTASEATNLDGLKKVMLNNRREREEDRQREPDIADGAMLRFLMQHLRHRARRQAREAGEIDSDSDSDTTDSDDLPTAQCATS